MLTQAWITADRKLTYWQWLEVVVLMTHFTALVAGVLHWPAILLAFVCMCLWFFIHRQKEIAMNTLQRLIDTPNVS